MKKYLVIPGTVVSKNDGQKHFINSKDLCHLYGVDPKECYFASSEQLGHTMGLPDGLIILTPKYDGNYALPTGSEPVEGK